MRKMTKAQVYKEMSEHKSIFKPYDIKLVRDFSYRLVHVRSKNMLNLRKAWMVTYRGQDIEVKKTLKEVKAFVREKALS